MSAADRTSPAGPSGRPSPRELWILAAIVVVAAVVRFASLDAASYWLDEAYSVAAVRGDLGGVWHAIVTTESTSPLYYLLGWGWADIFGTSAFGLRSLSALAGVALVPAVWLASRELTDRRAAPLAAALTATSPLLVWYSQEARAYELTVLLCVLALWQLARARRGAPHAAAWWAGLAALALTAHYVALFPVLAQAALLLWWRRDRAAVLAVAAVGVIGAALVPLAVTQRGNALANESTIRPLRALVETAKQFAVGYDLPLEVVLSAAALALMAAGAVLAARSPDRRRGVAVIAAVALASPVGLLLLYVAGQNQLMSRYMLPALPLVLLLVAAGFGARAAGRWGIAATGALCAIGLAVTVAVAVTPADRAREDWKGAAAALRSPIRPRVLLVFPPSGFLPLSLYLPGLGLTDPKPVVREVDLVDVGTDRDHRRDPPAPATLPLYPAFRLVATARSETYAVARYVAPAPAEVVVGALLGGQAADRHGTVLVQR